MDLDGHYLITRTAVKELEGKLSFTSTTLDLAAVNRDLEDVYTGGHWSEEGQKHHFMGIKGQSQQLAYAQAMRWIRTRAEKSVKAFQDSFWGKAGASIAGQAEAEATSGIRNSVARGSVFKGQTTVPMEYPLRNPQLGHSLTAGVRELGTAAHAVEDSFAPMHVQRSGRKITAILIYDGQDHEAHDKEDRKWEGARGSLWPIGREAVEAVKDLLRMVDASVRSKRGDLIGWDAYVEKWFQTAFSGGETPLVGGVSATAPVVKSTAPLSSLGQQHHTVLRGESLSSIAGIYYLDVLLWPVIHDANRNVVRDPNFIQPGWRLSIPGPESIPEGQKPALRERGRNWRRWS